MKYDLSILIPARNEMFLAQTVNDILSNIEGNTEIIIVLDGEWDNPKVPEDPRITIVYQSKAIGQRASTNKACRLSQAKYVMKCDAHVAFDKGFDVKLLKAMEGHDDWTVMPRLYNLHVFDWKCNKCGNRWYQGPTPKHCMNDEKTQNDQCDNTTDFEREMVWKPRLNRRSDFMRFDNDLHFQYFPEYGKRPEAQGEIADLMSILGACFVLTRERYWDLNICDEDYGSWGGQGTEVACKSWLSGGRLVVYKGTWYSHLFRTQGGDFGFPYVQSGKQIDHARQMNRDFWFNNSWPKQVRPLSWLVEKFWPVAGWTDEDLLRVKKAGEAFLSRKSNTNSTSPQSVSVLGGEKVIPLAKDLPRIITPFSSQNIGDLGDKQQVVGITTGGVIANKVVENKIVGEGFNKPSIHESMNHNGTLPDISEIDNSVSIFISKPIPDPTVSDIVDSNVRKDRNEVSRRDSKCLETLNVNHDITSVPKKSIIFYTDNQLNLKIAHSIQKQLLKISREKGIPIVSASLKPMSFGDKNIVLPLKRGYITMAKQILSALEASPGEIVYFCEHDVKMHPTHFDFTPPKDDVFYYNTNVWKTAWKGEYAFRVTDCKQLSGLCVNREFAIKHFKKRVEMMENKFAELKGDPREFSNFVRAMGFEPGTHNRQERVDTYGCDSWESEYPNIDIRHDSNLTRTRWSPDEFRNKKYAEGWTESTVIDGWGKVSDIF